MSKIINLTRTIVPKISANPKENIASINALPEMVLAKMMRQGNKSIVRTDMNHCTASVISKSGVNTVYTDGLCGCNSIGIIAKCLDGNPLVILSHYVPTNNAGQLDAIERELSKCGTIIDKSVAPRLFMNIGGYKNASGQLVPSPNPIVAAVKNVITKFFPKGADTTITPYPTKNRGAFFSSANIFQFDPADVNQVKITNVGEKESFLNLNA